MRTRTKWMWLAVAALALAGCGAGRLVLRVDVLSYLDAGLRQTDFGPLPPVPGGFATGEIPLVDDARLNLLDGLQEVAEVQSVTILLSAIVVDSTGSGSDTLRVYASAVDVDPRTTPPILERAVVLVPGVTDTVEAEVAGDARLEELFLARQMRLRVTTSLRGPVSGDPLNGRLALRRLEAIVIAGKKKS